MLFSFTWNCGTDMGVVLLKPFCTQIFPLRSKVDFGDDTSDEWLKNTNLLFL